MPAADVTTAEKMNYVPVGDFYAGKSVFVTGGTGFLGKVFIEKLLYSCPRVDKIYVLIRMKKNCKPEQRIQQLFENPLFTRIKEKRPDDLKKILPIIGDVTSPNLGISLEDEQTLREKVSVVYHSAATLKFNEPLRVALDINLEGTKRVLELCHRMKKLEAFVYVSTAYSNSNRDFIEEVVYPPPAQLSDVYTFLDQHDGKTDAEVEILNGRPNTYVFTKALTECYVSENHGDIPTAIVRPSMIISIKDEPLAGWLENYNGPTFHLTCIIKGIFRSMLSHKSYIADLIPVDYVSNLSIIAAARCVKTDTLKVYNSCSSSTNPVTWKKFMDLSLASSQKMGIGGFYPLAILSTNPWTVNLLQFIFQILPAYFMDFWRFIWGKKPIYAKIQYRILREYKRIEFFTNRSWVMDVRFASELFSSLSPEDQQQFPCDPQEIDWETYVHNYCDGINKYLKPFARSKVSKNKGSTEKNM